MDGRPIANKYREGKMQRTLKRECKELEVVEREAIAGSEGWLPSGGLARDTVRSLGRPGL